MRFLCNCKEVLIFQISLQYYSFENISHSESITLLHSRVYIRNDHQRYFTHNKHYNDIGFMQETNSGSLQKSRFFLFLFLEIYLISILGETIIFPHFSSFHSAGPAVINRGKKFHAIISFINMFQSWMKRNDRKLNVRIIKHQVILKGKLQL